MMVRLIPSATLIMKVMAVILCKTSEEYSGSVKFFSRYWLRFRYACTITKQRVHFQWSACNQNYTFALQRYKWMLQVSP